MEEAIAKSSQKITKKFLASLPSLGTNNQRDIAMVVPVVSMVFPWFFHGFSLIFPWFFHGYTHIIQGFPVSSGFFLQINGKSPQVWGSPCVAATSPPTGAVPPASSVGTPRGFSKAFRVTKCRKNVGFGRFFLGFGGFFGGFSDGLPMIFATLFWMLRGVGWETKVAMWPF